MIARWGVAVAAIGLVACRREEARKTAGVADSAVAGEAIARVRCAGDLGFGARWSIAEASGAAEVELSPGVREMAVAADSDNDGAVLLLPLGARPGALVAGTRKISLPLDHDASDDIEAIAWREGALFTLTSAGAVRRFVPDGKGALAKSGGAYPIGPPPLSCPRLAEVNCGRNYEGLCLRGGSVRARCAGYAASKQDDALHCVVIVNGKLMIDTVKRPLKLDLPRHAVSDCAFGTEGGPAENTLVVTTNVYGGSKSYVVDEVSGALARIDLAGHVTNEAMAIDRDGALYQFMDDGREPSSGSRATCVGW